MEGKDDERARGSASTASGRGGADLNADQPVALQTAGIRFSQNTVSGPTYVQGRQIPLPCLATQMRILGYRSEPIDVVTMPDGKLTSLDNRRLWAAQQAGLETIPARVHHWNEPAPKSWGRKRFKASREIRQTDAALRMEGAELIPQGRVARTFYEAVVIRGSRQRPREGERFPLAGSADQPRYTRERPMAREQTKSAAERSEGRQRPVKGALDRSGSTTASKPDSSTWSRRRRTAQARKTQARKRGIER